MTLHEIGLKHGTDKATFHNYCDFYERHLDRNSITSLLELGIFKGASLKMWREWLPAAAAVEGWDIAPIQVPRCMIQQVDCSSISAMTKAIAGRRFNLIVDDASHIWEHQRAAFKALFPFCDTYIIEDIHTSVNPAYGTTQPIYDQAQRRLNLDADCGLNVRLFQGKPDNSWTAIIRRA